MGAQLQVARMRSQVNEFEVEEVTVNGGLQKDSTAFSVHAFESALCIGNPNAQKNGGHATQ